MTRHAARARLLGCIMLLALACLVGATSARADVPGPITTRVMAILNAAGSGTTGMYVKEVGGPVIAAQNESFAFAPGQLDQGAPAPLPPRPACEAGAADVHRRR